MSVQVHRRRDIASYLTSFVPAQGELIVDTTNNRVIVGDGTTANGWPAAKLSEVPLIAPPVIISASGAVTISNPGIYWLTATGVSVKMGSIFGSYGLVVIKEMSGSSSPGSTITGTIDGSAGTLAIAPYDAIWLQPNTGYTAWARL